MREDTAAFWFFVLIAVIFAGGIFYYASQRTECDEAKGVLVKDAVGFYACIEKGQH